MGDYRSMLGRALKRPMRRWWLRVGAWWIGALVFSELAVLFLSNIHASGPGSPHMLRVITDALSFLAFVARNCIPLIVWALAVQHVFALSKQLFQDAALPTSAQPPALVFSFAALQGVFPFSIAAAGDLLLYLQQALSSAQFAALYPSAVVTTGPYSPLANSFGALAVLVGLMLWLISLATLQDCSMLPIMLVLPAYLLACNAGLLWRLASLAFQPLIYFTTNPLILFAKPSLSWVLGLTLAVASLSMAALGRRRFSNVLLIVVAVLLLPPLVETPLKMQLNHQSTPAAATVGGLISGSMLALRYPAVEIIPESTETAPPQIYSYYLTSIVITGLHRQVPEWVSWPLMLGYIAWIGILYCVLGAFIQIVARRRREPE